MLTPVEQADVLGPRDFGGEAHAAGALNTAGHDRLDQRPHVLFFDRALVLGKAGAVAAKGLRLILQVALATLIANRAVQRVVEEQELHHAFARLLHLVGAGVDHEAVAARQRTGGGGLGRTAALVFDFDQTHAAVAGHRQTVVVAEPGDLSPGEFRDLKNAHPVFEFDFNTVHDGFGHDDTRLW